MFGYFKIPGVILSLGSSQKLNWTHTFDTHCKYTTSVQFMSGTKWPVSGTIRLVP